jgi:hypothetical protein
MSVAPTIYVHDVKDYAKNFDMSKAPSHQKKIAKSGFGDKFKTLLKMVGAYA